MKKFFMRWVWRIQQAQMLIGIIFWSMTLTGVFYPITVWYLETYFNITGVLTGMVVLFGLIFGGILLFGLLYDRVFKMWKPQQVVMVERNQYQHEQLTPRDMVMFEEYYLPLARAINEIKPNAELTDSITSVEGWLDRNGLIYAPGQKIRRS